MGRIEYLIEPPQEEIKLIEGSDTDYISKTGNVYKKYKNGKWIQKKFARNYGYEYVGINYKGISINMSRRVHRLVAQAFIPNPENLTTVMHLNNIKHDNRVENLKWGTVSENTQQAADDGLLVNDIGIEDSQSFPIAFYKNDGELISVYGSISSGGRLIKGSSKSVIAKVVDKTTHGRKGYYFKTITKEEYWSTLENIRELPYEIPYIKKTRRKFKAVSPNGEIFYSDNQKEFAQTHNLKQACISQVLRKNRIHYDGWQFYEVENYNN